MDFLNLQTIVFVSFIEALVLGLIFIFYSLSRKRYPGTFELGLCLILVSLGMLLMAAQKISGGDRIFFVLSDTVFTGGLCLTPYGFRKFFFKNTRPGYYIFLTTVVFFSSLSSSIIYYSPFIRQGVTILAQMIIFFESFYLLFFNSDRAVRIIARAASIIYFLLGSIFALRVFALIFFQSAVSPGLLFADAGTARALAALTLVFSVVAIISGYTFFIMMVTRRLESEVREGEAQKALYISELEAADAARSKFYSVISHDLRGPIGGMQELLTTVSRRADIPADAMEYIRVLKDTSESAGELLNNLLQWTRAELGRTEVNPEPVRAADIITRTVKLFEIKIKNKGLNVVNETDGGLYVHADPTLFSTIIRNLLSNAVKFTPDGGIIRFSGAVSCENGGRAMIRVSDTGIGIDAASLEKLFTLDNKSAIKFGTAGESGSGLGLLICRDFAKLMGGIVSAASEPGGGSVFTVELPAAERPAAV